jgi:IPT/TIG domain-containing protein
LLTGLMPIPNVIFNRPIEVLSLSNGKAMVRLRQPVSSEALLALWDPNLNSLTDLTSAVPAIFQQGVGALAHSGDHSRVLAAANDSSGNVALFGSAGNVLAGPVALGTGTAPFDAANNDASRFAVVFVAGGKTQVLLLDALLQQVASYVAANVSGLTFSRDGKQLYVAETSTAASFVTVLDGLSGQLVARVPDAPIQGAASMIEDADETQRLFALSNRGLSFLDASTPGMISLTAPTLAPAPSAQPSEGPIAGGTPVVLSGQNFTSPVQVKFGSQFATNLAASSSTQIQVTSPASVVNGLVNLTAYLKM